MISSGISSSLLKLVGIVVFFLVFKGVSLTNAAELRIGVTYLSAPNPSLSIIQKTTDYLNTHLVDGVRLQFYEIRELEEAIRKHEVDRFFLEQAFTAVCMITVSAFLQRL